MTAAVDVMGPAWTPALLFTDAGAGVLRCDLCPHGCELAAGQTGACAVRRHHEGTMQTATFAASVAHLDAIERKPLYHVRPGSRVLTIGAPGCSFRCNYCINHRLSQYGRVAGVTWSAAPVDAAALVARAAADSAAVGMSYSEPGLAPELTLALAEYAGPAGVPIVWKSNGFLTPAAVDLVAPHLDAVNVDVKAASEPAHRRLTGAPLRPVLDTVERLRAAGVWVEVSTPLIPGISAAPRELGRIAAWLAAIDPAMPWHLLRFTPDFRMTGHAPTSPAQLAEGVAVAREAGLAFVYVERALSAAGRRTDCARCGWTVVDRGIWSTVAVSVDDGRCPRCATDIPGRWTT